MTCDKEIRWGPVQNKYDITRWGIPSGEIVFKQKMRRRRWWKRLKNSFNMIYFFSLFPHHPDADFRTWSKLQRCRRSKIVWNICSTSQVRNMWCLKSLNHITKEPWFIIYNLHTFFSETSGIIVRPTTTSAPAEAEVVGTPITQHW